MGDRAPAPAYLAVLTVVQLVLWCHAASAFAADPSRPEARSLIRADQEWRRLYCATTGRCPEDTDYHGGYYKDPGSFMLSGRCDVERVLYETLAVEGRFKRDYYDAGKPVIVTGVTRDWKAVREERWFRANISDPYGNLMMQLQTSAPRPYEEGELEHTLTNYVPGRSMRTLAVHLNHLTPNKAAATKVAGRVRKFDFQGSSLRPRGLFDPYIFDDAILQEERTQQDYELPSIIGFNAANIKKWYFSLGGSLTGTFWHEHGPALSVTVFGRKRMFLIPAKVWGKISKHRKLMRDFEVHPTEWYMRHYDTKYKSRVQECVVSAGEALFIPDHWGHAVVNIGETLGVAFEMYPESCGTACL